MGKDSGERVRPLLAVWKFAVPGPNSEPFVTMPKGAKMLHVAVQDGVPYLWALVLPANPLCRRRVATYPTGAAVHGWPTYLGTFHIERTDWHVFYTMGDLPLPAAPPAVETCAHCGQDIYGGPGVWHVKGGYEVCPAEGHPFHEPLAAHDELEG